MRLRRVTRDRRAPGLGWDFMANDAFYQSGWVASGLRLQRRFIENRGQLAEILKPCQAKNAQPEANLSHRAGGGGGCSEEAGLVAPHSAGWAYGAGARSSARLGGLAG